VDNVENIIFTNNCTTALNTVIKGTLKKGDHVIISSLEHNAVLRPVASLKKQGVSCSVARVVQGDDEQTISNFRELINAKTKMIICTHASNVFGIKLPIKRIGAMCKIYGILFCVDAAQTAGIENISLKNCDIDYLCTAGHKGLYGPMGTGVLVINSEHTPDSLVQGGTGSFSADINQPDVLP
jgi:selenocysteine lyase/cysteine desulfurase